MGGDDPPYLTRYVRSFSFDRKYSTFNLSFLISVPLMKPRTLCACQPVSSMISGSVAPWERRIRSITSAFLLPSRATLTGSFAAAGSVWRRLLFAASLFRLPSAGATWAAGFATFAGRTWTASQMRATAVLRSVNFFTGLSAVNGATPAKLFQISTVRLRGQDATSLASSWGEPKYSALWILAARASSNEATAVMLLFVSIVKVFICDTI